MELKETVKFKEPCRLVWTVVCSRFFGGSVKLHYKDSTFPLFAYEFGNTIQRTPRVESGQMLDLMNHDLTLTVATAQAENLHCLTKNSVVRADSSGETVAESRWFLFDTSDNPDSRDYSALSVSLVNFTKRV